MSQSVAVSRPLRPTTSVTWAALKREFMDTYRFRYVIISYVQVNLRVRYRRSVLGFFWSVLAPLLNYLVIGMVFSFITKARGVDFFLYFFSGSVFYNLLSTTVVRGTTAMIDNETYMKKLYLPKLVFILNGVSLELVNFFFGLLALAALGSATMTLTPDVTWLVVPGVLAMTLLALVGVSCLLSVVSVFFRDLVHVAPVMMQTVFFLTPVVYKPSYLPEQVQKFLVLNPVYHFVECFRMPLTEGRLPDPLHFGVAAGFSVFTFCLGIWVLKRFDNKIVFKL